MSLTLMRKKEALCHIAQVLRILCLCKASSEQNIFISYIVDKRRSGSIACLELGLFTSSISLPGQDLVPEQKAQG